MIKNQKRAAAITVVAVIAVVIAATALVNRNLIRHLDATYGVEDTLYYDMGETVPFEDDVLIYGDESLNGYSLRIDSAQVITYEDFLSWIGRSEKSAADLLGVFAESMPEKLCLLTMTIYNENCDAEGIILNNFTLGCNRYGLAFDSQLTVMCNDFLMMDYNSLDYVFTVGIRVPKDSEVAMYLVYDYSDLDFSARHWERLAEDKLYFEMAWLPETKYIALELE